MTERDKKWRKHRETGEEFHITAMFAAAVDITREYSMPIEDVARCFKAQYEPSELEKLIEELKKPLQKNL